jgi:septal ring factor EnvC (AmiA/AmiB activator)
MKKKNFLILFLTAFTLSFSLSAAKNSSRKIRLNLKAEKSKLSKIAKEMAKVEKELEKSNRSVLQLGKKKVTLEQNLYSLKRSLLTSMSNLGSRKSELKRLLRSVTVNTLDSTDSPEQMLAKKILILNLKKRLSNFQSQMKKTRKAQQQLQKVEASLKLYIAKEELLLDSIAQLESSKRKRSGEYVLVKSRYEKFLKKWQRVKVKKSRTSGGKKLRTSLGTFRPPIESHKALDFRKKGVTFLFSKRQPVIASRSGKVIHSGSLSTYGNVLMLDHGKDTISVCLGDFKAQVAKGKKVRAGDVIGYTFKPKRKDSKLYFEVRIKDKAQATIHLLDEKALVAKKM